jgi:hypothetical protein
VCLSAAMLHSSCGPSLALCMPCPTLTEASSRAAHAPPTRPMAAERVRRRGSKKRGSVRRSTQASRGHGAIPHHTHRHCTWRAGHARSLTLRCATQHSGSGSSRTAHAAPDPPLSLKTQLRLRLVVVRLKRRSARQQPRVVAGAEAGASRQLGSRRLMWLPPGYRRLKTREDRRAWPTERLHVTRTVPDFQA